MGRNCYAVNCKIPVRSVLYTIWHNVGVPLYLHQDSLLVTFILILHTLYIQGVPKKKWVKMAEDIKK